MELATHDTIIERSRSLEGNADFTKFVAQIENHLLTGDNEFFWVGSDEEKFDRLVELVGHTTFDGAKVLAYNYAYNGKGDSYSQLNLDPHYEGEWPLWGLLNRLGDIGSNLEFMNDYVVKVAVKLDDESMMFYEHQSSSIAVVCEDCQDLEEFARGGGSEDYSCDHCDDEDRSNFHVALLKIPDPDTFEGYLVHGF